MHDYIEPHLYGDDAGMFTGYGLLAAVIRNLVVQRKSIMKNVGRGFACIFAGLAVKLALEDR